MSEGKTIPGPNFLQSFSYFKRVPEKGFLNLLTEMQDQFGEWSAIRVPNGQKMCIVTNPDDIYAILHTHAQKFVKGKSVELFKLLIGNGLPVSDGEDWRKQRRVLQPAFHRQYLETYLDLIHSTTQTHVEMWKKQSSSFDMTTAVARLTHDIIARNLFGTDLGDSLHELQQAWAEALGFIVHRSFQPIRPPLLLPTTKNRKFHRAMELVNKSVDRIIKRRLAQTQEERGDHMLSRLIKARAEDDGGEILTDRNIRDQVLAFLFAGHETTANNIAFTLYLILTQPKVQAQILDEIATVLTPGRTLTIDVLNEMVYLKQVIYESLRIYPPAAIFVREAIENVVVSGYLIPKETVVYISPYVVHRRPDLWSQPEVFDPSRFEEIAKKAGPRKPGPTNFIAFGSGPRTCIGEQFAMLEAQIVISTLLSAVNIRLTESHDVELIFNGTLRPGPLPIRVTAR